MIIVNLNSLEVFISYSVVMNGLSFRTFSVVQSVQKKLHTVQEIPSLMGYAINVVILSRKSCLFYEKMYLKHCLVVFCGLDCV